MIIASQKEIEGGLSLSLWKNGRVMMLSSSLVMHRFLLLVV
jgi:hypothetical protein